MQNTYLFLLGIVLLGLVAGGVVMQGRTSNAQAETARDRQATHEPITHETQELIMADQQRRIETENGTITITNDDGGISIDVQVTPKPTREDSSTSGIRQNFRFHSENNSNQQSKVRIESRVQQNNE